MITALKLLWTSTGGRVSVLLFGALFAASVAFAYSYGNTSGYKSGFTAGQESRNAEVKDLKDKVDALTKTISDERKAQDLKLKSVEKEAANAAIATQQKLSKQVRERDAIIRDYEQTTSIEIKESCGLSIETVRAINLLIDNANEKAGSTSGVPTLGSGAYSPDAGHSTGLEGAQPRALKGEDNE